MNDLFPTLFGKTFFIVGSQLVITWLATTIVFYFFKRADPNIENEDDPLDRSDSEEKLTAKPPSNLVLMKQHNPECAWVFSPEFIGSVIFFNMVLFVALLFWGANQALPVSFTLFSLWSITMGVELEFCLINYDHGLGRRVTALTACIVFAAGLMGLYSKVDFGFLQIPLFIALNGLLVFYIARLLGAMPTVKQKFSAIFGVVLFTLYLLFDFNVLAQKNSGSANGWGGGANEWSEAMHISIKLYLDIINLFLHLLAAMGKHH